MNGDRRQLLIPMHIDALVVSANDRAGASSPLKNGTVSAAPDYALLKKSYRTGSELRQPLEEKALAPGVHLHFRLPAAAAHGDLKKQAVFPTIPNRWLVQRYYNNQSAVRTKAWLVYSDKEAKDPKDKASAVVLLAVGSQGEHCLRPTGMTKVIWDGNRGAGDYDYSSDNAAAEVKLTAATGGDIGFSAHYPACQSILGFHDDLTDVPADPDLKLSYLVTGWYSAEIDDPWSGLVSGLTSHSWHQLSDASKARVNEWLEERGYVAKFGNDPLPSGMLCHGAVKRVGRKADGSALSTSHQDPFVDFDSQQEYWVDLGNTSAEAFAARVASVRNSGPKSANPVDSDLLEDLVTALQTGLLSQGSNTAEMDSELHRQSFAALAGGQIWVIQQAAATAAPQKGSQTAPELLPPVPTDLQEQLADLNRVERDWDRHRRLLRDYRWELYALWHRWTDAVKRGSTKSHNALKPNLDVLSEFVRRYEIEVRSAAQKRDQLKTDLGVELALRSDAPGAHIKYSLSQQPDGPFYVPKDPVVLLTGPAAQAAGTRGRPSSICVRTTGEELQSFSYDRDQHVDLTFAADDAASGVSAECLKAIPPWSARLFRETLLLDEMEKIHPKKSRNVRETKAKAGILPDDFSGFSWEHNPWIPLYLHWQVSWQADGLNREIKKQWTLRQGKKEEPHYRRNSELIPFQKIQATGKKAEYKGLSLVGTPLFNLQYARGSEEGQGASETTKALGKLMRQIDESLGSRPNAMISQALTGLTEALIMRQVGDQLPPLDYSRWKKDKEHPLYVDPISATLGADFHPDSSPFTPTGGPPADTPPFCPLRDGLLHLGSLWIIDVFGQRTRIEPGKLKTEQRQSPALGQASRLSLESPPAVRLTPRLCSPFRVRFEGLPVAFSGAGASPVCGWVIVNRFDQNLVLYTADGRPAGILQQRFASEGETLFYWVAVPGALGAKAKVDGLHDPFLREFANFVLSLDFSAGRAFVALINEAVQAAEQRVPEDNPLLSVLIGRPLALIRAELRLEIDGLPALDQKLSWAESAQPGEPSLSDVLKTSRESGNQPAPNRFMKTGDVEKVRWPVRLGDRRTPTDGLVGFFQGDSGARPFYAAKGYDFGNVRYPGLEDVQDLELDGEKAQQFTLLMDPQARVHVTAGVLPRLHLELSAEQLKGVRQVREIFFQTAPVLGTRTMPHVPKPSDDYGQWSWSYRPRVTGWAEDPNMVSAANLAGPEVGWPTLTEGWLKLKLEPVLIRSLWMKAPAQKPQKGTNVTLAWSLHDADTVQVFRLRPDRSEEPKPENQWNETPLACEWTSLVEVNTTFRIKASNKAGYQDEKDIEIETED